MNIQTSIALDTLAIVYMVILLANLKHKHKRELLNIQYCEITVMICVFLLLDILYLAFYGRAEWWAQVAMKAAKSLYFVANSAIVWLWGSYMDCIIFGPQHRSPQRRLYTAVFLVNTALVAVNLWGGMLFEISPEGTFVVGPTAMWTFSALNYFSMLVITLVLARNREKVPPKHFLPLLLFPLPPVLAEILQIFYRPFSLISAYSISALIVFQVSQNSIIYTDALTGLANRRMLDETLRRWFSEQRGGTICGLMIDLDGLKQINDTYGHVSGDNALLALADMIKEVKRKDILAARYGGDEFMMIWRGEGEKGLAEVERKLEEARSRSNSVKPEQERIAFSVGGFCCRDDRGITSEQFLKNADEKMYRRKKEKKANDKS